MECPIASAIHHMDENRMRPSFDVFKSNICHQVKDLGDIPFITELLQSNQIRKLYEKKWYPESLYLLAMPDYLSRENNVPICKNYNDLRSCKLQKLVFPSSIVILCLKINLPTFWRKTILQIYSAVCLKNRVPRINHGLSRG